ncbi:cryptochrome/photolyase family protein [Bordetella petrii]|uniref:cryptochrome/photolyase family protein n=1 Tax=Bordetella petrii TaxID=94624 RepID=UPI001E56A9CC|nr:deoxyribodipyrimidine photo-lyase [Bordetella petrii]MCD0503351.1 DNA photolyase family protein [Bordetella petrii]
MPEFERGLMWFRRDLRVKDNATLYGALRQCTTLYCVFVFDTDILSELPRDDRRVAFIHDCIAELDAELRDAGGKLLVCHGAAADVIPDMAGRLRADAVFAGKDYEPRAIARDSRVAASLSKAGRDLVLYKDQVIFECDEILNGAGEPYRVFTAYKNAWLKALPDTPIASIPRMPPSGGLAQPPAGLPRLPSLEDLGFSRPAQPIPLAAGAKGAQALFADFRQRMGHYHERRDFPGVKGPSYLSVHLRFGTISIRSLVRTAYQAMQKGNAGAATWLSELVWRDFYFMILFQFPHVEQRAFRPEYDAIPWETGPEADAWFAAWCQGSTGYPIVDAAMRQLNQTGYMHNRLRMITASFLAKDLGIDWRRGERYFARQLNDYDLAANNGGWQWAASTGCDAQPYFRIFNPVMQSRKFDSAGHFIRRYVPEVAALPDKHIHAPWLAPDNVLQAAEVELGSTYPRPVVDHDSARKVALARYGILKA